MRPPARHPGLGPRVPRVPRVPRPHLSLRPLSCPSSCPPRGRGKTGSSPQRAAAEMRQTGWSGREDGGRKRTGYLERPANSWAYLCAAEAQESLQNSAQLERGPRPAPGPGLRPRPVAPRAVAGCWWQGGDAPGTGRDGDGGSPAAGSAMGALGAVLGALGEAPVSPWCLQKGPDGDAPAPPTRLLLSSPSSWCLPVSELFFIIMPR